MRETMTENSEAVYDALIYPLMTQIITICRDNKIPMLCTFQYAADDGTRASFCTTYIPFVGMSPALKKCLHILTGPSATVVSTTVVSP